MLRNSTHLSRTVLAVLFQAIRLGWALKLTETTARPLLGSGLLSFGLSSRRQVCFPHLGCLSKLFFILMLFRNSNIPFVIETNRNKTLSFHKLNIFFIVVCKWYVSDKKLEKLDEKTKQQLERSKPAPT